MVIEAISAPLEVLLAIQAFDNDGKLIPRVVHLDTDEMVAKQLLLIGDKLVFKHLNVSRFYFAAPTTGIVESLRVFLPESLHGRIVTATSEDSE